MNHILKKNFLTLSIVSLLSQAVAAQFVSDNGAIRAYSDRSFSSFSGSLDSATYTNVVVPVEGSSDYCRLKNNGSTRFLGGGVYGYATRVKYNGTLYDVVNVKIRIYYDYLDKAMRAGIRFEDAATADSGYRFNAGASISNAAELTYADGSSIYQDLFNCANGRLSYGRGFSLRQAETDQATAIRQGLLFDLAVRLKMVSAQAVLAQPVKVTPIRRLPSKFRFLEP